MALGTALSERYTTYPKYKASDIVWLGKIPISWTITKMAWNFQASKGKNGQLLTKEYCGLNSGDYPVYSGQTENKGIMGRINVFEFDTGEQGVLFSTTVGAKAMHLSHLTGKFSLSQNCMIIVPQSKDYHVRFSFYHFQPLFAYERGLIPEHMQASFRVEDLNQYQIALPSIEEQEKIANFLDHEIAKIDTLIDKQQQLIKLLKESRKSAINKAVTQGLDSNVIMRDSGIDWLGKIPKHWKITKAKYLFDEQCRPVRNIDGIVTVFRDGQVCLRSRRRNSGFTMAVLEHGYQGIRKGDLVLHSMDAFAGAIGVSEDDGRATPEYVVTKPYDSEMNCEYYADILRLMAERDYIFVLCPSVRERAPRFRFSKFQQVLLPVPPNDEQDEIENYLSNISTRYITLTGKAEEQINLLKERRTSLISAAVTGKIDIRNWKKPESSVIQGTING